MRLMMVLLLVAGCGHLMATNSPSGGVDPKVASIEKVISDALDIRADYIDLEKSKAYNFDGINFNFDGVGGVASEPDDLDDFYKKTQEYVDNPKVKKAIEAIEGLGASQLIETLTENDLVKLPLGIVKTFGKTTYSIVFDQAKIFTEYAEVRVYGRIKNDKVDLCFGAEDIKISFDGGIIGETTLALFGDFVVPMKTKKIGIMFKQFDRQQDGEHGGSYITFDCDGFVEASLDVDIALSRDWVLPTNDLGKVIGGNARVVGNIATKFRDIDDFVAEASMPHFTMTRDTSVAILVSRAIFDYSDVNNAVGFQHPQRYNFTEGTFDEPPSPEEVPLWTGFYIEQIEFIMPHIFKTSDDQPLIIGAEKLYVDQKGVSGLIYGEGLIPIETGTIGESGWAFALDFVGVTLNCSKILKFDFNGRINIPVNEETQKLNYAAWGIPSEEHYNVTVGLDSTMTFPIFKAGEVRLNRGSAITLEVKEGDFVPNAILCGGMYVKIGKEQEGDEDSKVELDMPGVEFNKLLVRDTMPYLTLAPSGGSISLHIPPIVNNSPITIDALTLTRKGEDKVSLGFALEVSVQGSDSGGGKSGGEFGILGVYKEVNGKNRWAYDGIEVASMGIEIVMGDYLWIEGGLEFYEGDDTWGNGFYGYLKGGLLAQDAGDEKIGEHNKYKVKMQASARFGTKFPKTEQEYKYWAYDFYISSSDKLFDIYPPIYANGLGGGIYHHMRMDSYNMGEMAAGSGDNPYSGISYKPSATTLFGLKLSLGMGIDGVDGLRGNVTLELAIDENLALQDIMLYGNGEFVSDKFEMDALAKLGSLTKSKEDSYAQDSISAATNNQNKITAAIMIHMDFENGFELQGNFAAFLNAGDGALQGTASVDLFISEERQHLYIGGYDGLVDAKGQQVGRSTVALNLGGFSVHVNFYLVTGNMLPPPPPVPPSIATAFGQNPNQENRDRLPGGGDELAAGFAMGASVKIKTDITIIKIVKFHFDFLSGFDLALLSNPSSSYCSALGSGEHGLKGWRATGNIYSSISMSVKVWVVWWRDLYQNDFKVWLSADTPSPSNFFVKFRYKNWYGNWKIREFEYGKKCGTVLRT